MRRYQSLLIITIAVVLAITVLLSFIPDIGASLALTFFVVGLELSAAAMAVSGLGKFQNAFKKVYYLIAAGISLVALNSIVASAFGLINIGDSNPLNLISNVLSTTGIGLMFWGMVKLNGLIGGTPNPAMLAGSFAATAMVGGALVLMPHLSSTMPEVIYDLQNFIDLFVVPCGLIGGYLAFKIKHQVSQRYRHMVGSLGWALIVVSISIIDITVADFVSLPEGISNIVALVSSSVFMFAVLRAAYSLRKSTYEDTSRQNSATLVDVNLYLASLASTAPQVDPILDPMRRITSTIGPGKNLTATDKTELLQVSENLLSYLTTKEPIRSFTRQELQTILGLKFGDNWMKVQ